MSTRTQIIATIGPASGTTEIISQLLESGMDVARINFSHGTHESDGGYIDRIREAAAARGITVPVILDLSGPRGQTAEGHSFDAGKAEITQKDLDDLAFGIEKRVEYIAQSYVGSADDVLAMKGEIASRGASIPVIAKIERQAAVDGIDAIIAAADAIMVARGDLASAIPIEQLPVVEKTIIAKCKAAGKPVIVATGMLATMIEHDTPARSEAIDIAFAIDAGADAIMLSDETAKGEYPVLALQAMEKIALYSENADHTGALNAL